MSPVSNRPFTAVPATNRPFSVGRVTICLLPLLALLLWIVALSSLATAGDTATTSTPARMSVAVPARAKTADVVMLEQIGRAHV